MRRGVGGGADSVGSDVRFAQLMLVLVLLKVLPVRYG